MKYHHHEYVSRDPRIQDPAGTGIDRPDDPPDEVDVLIVGAGPAGMIAAAQLSQFPGVTTRIVDRRASRLEVGLAERAGAAVEQGRARALEGQGGRRVGPAQAVVADRDPGVVAVALAQELEAGRVGLEGDHPRVAVVEDR